MAKTSDKSLAAYEVLLCLTGSIACYKSVDLASRLIQGGAGVTVAMTDAAQRFICPLTFRSLTHRQVFTNLWQSGESYSSQHVSLTEAADLMVVAPASADIIAKIACGIADDLVSTMALATHGACDMLVAPAMNSRMWSAPATCANMQALKGRGVHVVGPAEGPLACRSKGPGRMAEPSDIFTAAAEIIRRKPPKKTAG